MTTFGGIESSYNEKWEDIGKKNNILSVSLKSSSLPKGLERKGGQY